MKVYYDNSRKALTELRYIERQSNFKGILWYLIEESDTHDCFITKEMEKEGRQAFAMYSKARELISLIKNTKGKPVLNYEKFMKDFYQIIDNTV
jgi:hypothetical protein